MDISECHRLTITELFYLPHTIVTKSTKKLRVVPNAYTHSRVGMTHSDISTAGSTLPNRLVYRSHRDTGRSVTLPADIINMCRQNQVDPRDRKHLLASWRDTPQQDLRYRYTHKVNQGITVTRHCYQAASVMHYVTRTTGLRPDLDTQALRDYDAQGIQASTLPRMEVQFHTADRVDFHQVFIQLSFHTLDLFIASTHTVWPVSPRRYAVTFDVREWLSTMGQGSKRWGTAAHSQKTSTTSK